MFRKSTISEIHLRWNLFTLIRKSLLWDEYFSLQLKFIKAMKIHFRHKLFIVMKMKMSWPFKIMLDIHHYYEVASSWWKFIKMMKIYDFDERFFIVSQLWWLVLSLIEIHHYDEDSSLWWEFIIVMRIRHWEQSWW